MAEPSQSITPQSASPAWQGVLTTALGGSWSFEQQLARLLDQLETRQ